jgi:hypothetical protein
MAIMRETDRRNRPEFYSNSGERITGPLNPDRRTRANLSIVKTGSFETSNNETHGLLRADIAITDRDDSPTCPHYYKEFTNNKRWVPASRPPVIELARYFSKDFREEARQLATVRERTANPVRQNLQQLVQDTARIAAAVAPLAEAPADHPLRPAQPLAQEVVNRAADAAALQEAADDAAHVIHRPHRALGQAARERLGLPEGSIRGRVVESMVAGAVRPFTETIQEFLLGEPQSSRPRPRALPRQICYRG